MMLNPLTLWYHPSPPRKASQVVVFTITLSADLLYAWKIVVDGKERSVHRLFRCGIEYPITGYRRDEATGQYQVMLPESRILTLTDPDRFTISCRMENQPDDVSSHDDEYAVNTRNAKERKVALKDGIPAYGYYNTAERDVHPLFYVATRPNRNQPYVNVVDEMRAARQAELDR